MTTNTVYLNLLRLVSQNGQKVSPRHLPSRELIGHVTSVAMQYPVITLLGRNLDYAFMCAEAEWILSGDRRLNRHETLSRNLSKYSDDGITMRGAYGPPFLQQVEYVVHALVRDKSTRQAVITLWERSPIESKDIPCTVALQFLIRNEHLHTNVFMRSSDAWLGWPYDVFTFTMMSAYVILSFEGPRLNLGTLHIFAGSQHLYEKNHAAAMSLSGHEVNGDNLAIDIHRFNHPDDLRHALIAARDASDVLKSMMINLCH